MGVSCDVALSGREALDMISMNGGYNIYFVDWNMPEMDGIEFVKSINKENSENSVVVMISATDWNVIEDKARSVGIERFLPKPLFISSIAECITDCMNTAQLEAPELPLEPETNLDGHVILLAEDVEINREIVLALLEPTKLVIDCAENGARAVDMYLADPERYEMIFMDLQMPEMDGITATKIIRKSATNNSKNIPIIAMTANVFKEDIEKCLEAGMNGHLGKPLDIDEVISTLEKYLKS